MVLGYLELPKEDRPDEKIWHDPARLEEWFLAVEQRRKEGLEPVEQVDDAEMAHNELTRELLGETR